MNRRSAIVSSVQKSCAQFSAEELAAQISIAEAQNPTNRGTKKVKDWTIETLRDLLQKRQEHEETESKKAADLHNVQTLLVEGGDRFKRASAFLHEKLQPGTPWLLAHKADLQQPSKEELLDCLDRTVLVRNDEQLPMSERAEKLGEEERLYLSPGTETHTLYPNATTFDDALLLKNCVAFTTVQADRTPEWQAVKTLGSVAERRCLTGTTADGIRDAMAGNAAEVAQKIHTTGPQRQMAESSLLVEIGGHRLMDAATAILRSVPKSMRGSADDFWNFVMDTWPDYQRSLDHTVTINPPRSDIEELERINAYLQFFSEHPDFRGVPHPLQGILTKEKIQHVAAHTMKQFPQSVPREDMAKLFPHYGEEMFNNPAIVFSCEGGRYFFLAPHEVMSFRHPSGIRFTKDLSILKTLQRLAVLKPEHNWENSQFMQEGSTLQTLQRLAVLRPDIDRENFQPHEWQSGEMLNAETQEQMNFEHRCYEFKLTARQGLEVLMDKLQIFPGVRSLIQQRYAGTWNFTEGSLSSTILGDPGVIDVVVNFDEPDALLRRLRFDYRPEPNPGPPKHLLLHPAPFTKQWTAMDLLQHGMSQTLDWAKLPDNERPFPVAMVGLAHFVRAIEQAMPEVQTALDEIFNDAESTSDTTTPNWPLMIIHDMEFMLNAARRLDRCFTRKGPMSLVESVTRIALFGSLIKHRLIPSSLTTYYPHGLDDQLLHMNADSWAIETDTITQIYFCERPIMANLDTDNEDSRPFLDIFETFGIPCETLSKVRFVKEGERISFVCQRQDVPAHRIFHRSQNVDEERTLDLLAADPELSDLDIAKIERGHWISGTLPTVKELEGRLLKMDIVEDRLLPAPKDEVVSEQDEDDVVEGEGKQKKEPEQIPRLKCVRDALIRLDIEGKYTLDDRTFVPTSHQYEAAEQGHYVVVTISEANLQLLVSDDPQKGTRVIYNTIEPKHYTTIGMKKLQEQLGPTRLRFNAREQFISIVMSTIEARMKDPSPVYPVDSAYPSPLDTIPLNEEAKRALTRDFGLAAIAGNKPMHELTVGDFSNIESKDTVWSFGGAACGTAYLDRLAREFGLHATAINREKLQDKKMASAEITLEESDAAVQGKVQLTPDETVDQTSFRNIVLRMVLTEISPEYREATMIRAITAQKAGRAHDLKPMRNK